MDPQSEDLFFWLWSPVPMQLLWQEEELNKQDQIAQADGEWAVAIATPLHHFSPESRSLILDAGSDWKSDLAGPGKWQTVKALVTVGNPEWVSWPDGIYTVPSFEICGSCEKGVSVVENISRGWSKFLHLQAIRELTGIDTGTAAQVGIYRDRDHRSICRHPFNQMNMYIAFPQRSVL